MLGVAAHVFATGTDVVVPFADAARTVLATNNFGDTRSGSLAGPLGLFLVLLLATATVLLIRNMNTRLRRLPDRFPDPDRPGEPPDTSTRPTDDES